MQRDTRRSKRAKQQVVKAMEFSFRVLIRTLKTKGIAIKGFEGVCDE